MDNFIKEGSNNIYQDLGFEDAKNMKVKADIAANIYKTINKKNNSIETVSKLLGISSERIRAILDGHFHDINEYELLHILLQLGNDLEITIKPSADKQGQIFISNEAIICET